MRRYYHRRFLHNEVPAIVRLWLFRLLVPLAGHREFVERGGLSSDPLAEVLGLTIDPALDAYSRPSAFSDLRKLHRQEERKSSRARIPKSVVRNVGRLSDLVGLTECDRRILEFVVLLHSQPMLSKTAAMVGQISTSALWQCLSVVLDLPETDVRDSLNDQSNLCKSGLLSIDRTDSALLEHKLQLLSTEIAERICASDCDPMAFIRLGLRHDPTSASLSTAVIAGRLDRQAGGRLNAR